MSFPTNPVALGKVTVAAAGAPVPLINNFANSEGYSSLRANKMEVQALPDNTGLVYLGFQGMDKSTGEKVLRVLSAGETYSITDPAANNFIDVFNFYIDTDTSGEGVYANAHVH